MSIKTKGLNQQQKADLIISDVERRKLVRPVTSLEFGEGLLLTQVGGADNVDISP